MKNKIHHAEAPTLTLQLFVVVVLAVLVGGYHWSIREPIIATPELSVPTVSPSPAISGTEISRIDGTNKEIVFTIDGGAGEGSTEEILATLAKYKVKGTFFLTGKWIEENPEWTRRIVAEGHEIFNHSYSHPYFTQISAAEIAAELQQMDDLLFATAGVRTKPYYRAPYGDRNDAVNRAAFEAGYQHIYWSVDSLDWRPEETPQTIYDRVMRYIHPGAIVLMHVGNPNTGVIIDKLFATLIEQGYKPISLSEALGE